PFIKPSKIYHGFLSTRLYTPWAPAVLRRFFCHLDTNPLPYSSMKHSTILAFVSVLSLAMLGCKGGTTTGTAAAAGSAATGTAGGRVNAGGSTLVNPMMTKWASLYEKDTGVQVDYSGGGSSNGIQQTINRIFDFGCTDAPMNEEQLKKAHDNGGEVMHIPLVL